MPLPKKRKNDISVYNYKPTIMGEDVTQRRKELLERILKSDTALPDSVLHDDLDLGMLEFVKENFKVVSDGKQIPIIPQILTIQRWAEYQSTWSFSDNDGNIKIPFISTVRMPAVQPGTHPAIWRTIPERRDFFYTTVPTWNGTELGADVYKIPQPVAVDISYNVSIVCTKMRDLNKFNQIIMQKFTSRQAYTTVKGHYFPIILEGIEDNSNIQNVDERRFYIQTYKFILMGFLVDTDEFEVKPAISRMLIATEFMKTLKPEKKIIPKSLDITVTSFIGDGMQTAFSVGETIGSLIYVTLNGIIQDRDVSYYHISQTSRITFATPPPEGSSISVTYIQKKGSYLDSYGTHTEVQSETYTFDGNLLINTSYLIKDIISVDVNGLVEDEGGSYEIFDSTTIKFLASPVIGSKIGIIYLR